MGIILVQAGLPVTQSPAGIAHKMPTVVILYALLSPHSELDMCIRVKSGPPKLAIFFVCLP